MIKRQSNLSVFEQLRHEWSAGDLTTVDFISLLREGATQTDLLEAQIEKILALVNYPFNWCGLSQDQIAAVYWHVRGKSTRQTGEIIGKSKHTIRKHLVLAVRKIDKTEDWEIKIPDLADILFKLIKEELDATTRK